MEIDHHISRLHELADTYRLCVHETKKSRHQLNSQIQQMKRDGYTFPQLAKEAGLAQGTIQNIIAQDPSAPQYWRKRCTRKRIEGDYCDQIWVKNERAWCDNCTRGLNIENQMRETGNG